MEIKTLKSFVTVASLKSFSAAARELNTVQPAISRHIADLEDELGVSLFWRNTREVKITAAGLSLLKDAKKIIEQESLAKDQARRTAQGEIGTLRIGYMGSASFTFLPDLVRAYSKQYPNVKIRLFEMSVQEQIDGFDAGKLDIGISRSLPKNVKNDLSVEKLYMDSLFVVVPDSHPIATKKSLNLNELSLEPFILFKRNEAPGLFDKIINECHLSNFTPNISSQPGSMQTVMTEVSSGLGVSIVPGCIQRLYTKGCTFIPIKNHNPSISTELHYRTEPSEPTVEAFVNLTIKSLEDIQKKI